MPPKLRAVLSKRLTGLAEGLFYCPSCSTWRRSLPSPRTPTSISSATTRARHLASVSAVRYQSSSAAASATTVNSPQDVPQRLKELHEAVHAVQEAAANHVNLSRLQLAQRGLVSERPVIRIAVLGLEDAATTRRFVRLLLADPLKPTEDWEKYLSSSDVDSSNGVLIRYGDESTISVPNNLLPTISVPSTALKKGNVEILVTSMGANPASSDATITSDTLLVPTVAIRASMTGRYAPVRYPVHKSIVCGRGIDGLLAYSKLLARSDINGNDFVRGVFDFGVGQGSASGSSKIALVDIDRAEQALDRFRESVQNATEYERGWTTSGVQPLIDWISTAPGDERLDPSLRNLIDSVLEGTLKGIASEEEWKRREVQQRTIPQEVREELHQTVSAWAERAHTELRDGLGEGFASPRWRKLAWWKLFWRVDDVGMITSEILQRRWLAQAEKETIWLGGKMHQAGLVAEQDSARLSNESSSQPSDAKATSEVEDNEAGESLLQPPLWPKQITETRGRLCQTTVPSLQALAQSLVLFTVSTSGLTSALSALTYVSTSTTTLYEACTVAAVGLIYSFRRQQKKWDAARLFWEKEVHEEGRKTLKETEEVLRSLAEEGGRRLEPNEAVSETEQARYKVERAQEALQNVK